MNAANKAWYWLSAGVLALGLNGYYHDGGFQGLHQLAGQATAAVAESRSQFSQIASLAEVSWAENARCERQASGELVVVPPQAQARLAHLQERLGEMQAMRVQAREARLQQVMAKHEMERAKVEFQNNRIEVLTNQGHIHVMMPSLPRVEVDVPQGPVVDVAEPN